MCKTCNGLWNRDENSSRNIHKIMKNIINGIDRPSYLCRSKQVNGTTSVSYNQNLQEDESFNLEIFLMN